MPESDPLYDAERQMAEHEVSIVGQLFRKFVAGLPLGNGMTEAEAAQRVADVIASDPEAAELMQRLALLQGAARSDRPNPDTTEET